MATHKRSVRARILVPLFIGFLLLALAFIGISFKTFLDYIIADCVNYAYGLNSLIADSLDVDHISDYMEQGHDHPDYDAIQARLHKLRDAYPDVLYLYVYQIREDGCHVVFDLETEDTPGNEPGDVIAFDPSFQKYIPDLLAGREIEPVISNGSFGYLLTVYTPLLDSQGVCQCYVAVDCSMHMISNYVWDIIRQIALLFLIVIAIGIVVSVLLTDRGIVRPMKRLERHAYRDTLTGLMNRTAYYEYNQVLDNRIADGTADFSLLMADVNYLKRINDTHGHDKGNEYLKNAAELIVRTFGAETTYRIGGDEFVIVLENEAQQDVEAKILLFREDVARSQAATDLMPWQRVSAAAGIAKYDAALDKSTEDVLRRADGAMYQEKLAMKAVRRD